MALVAESPEPLDAVASPSDKNIIVLVNAQLVEFEKASTAFTIPSSIFVLPLALKLAP